MKKIIIVLWGLFAFSLGAGAQNTGGKVSVSGISTVETNGEVFLEFNADFTNRNIPRNNAVIYMPVITDGNYKVSFKPFIVHGKRYRASEARREWAAGAPETYNDAIIVGNERSLIYKDAVEAQEWMQGASLMLEVQEGGCCSVLYMEDLVIAQNVDLARVEPKPTIVPVEPEPSWTPVTVADHLSTAFTFVVPESEFDPEEPFKIYEDERENSLIAYFRVGKYDLDPKYMDNEQTLSNLTTTVNMILNSTDSRVNRIMVAGFASPEGSLELNDRLAFERAVSVKKIHNG